MALQHASEAVPRFRRRLAERDGAGDIGGAIGIWAARSDQIKLAWLKPAIGLFRGAVMDDRAMRPRAGDCVERQVAKLTGLLAQGMQPVGSGQLVDVALGCFDRK